MGSFALVAVTKMSVMGFWGCLCKGKKKVRDGKKKKKMGDEKKHNFDSSSSVRDLLSFVRFLSLIV